MTVLHMLLLALAVQTATATAASHEDSDKKKDSQAELLACFVIRTYSGHDDGHAQNPLSNLIKSLQAQTIDSWHAVLVVLDSQPFHNLQTIISDANDSRISLFAEWSGSQYQAKQADGIWQLNYHGMLYNLTDHAIRACPAARWVVVTNGDNEYDSRFLEYAKKVPKKRDIVAFDFYSRYQRPTAEQCVRFQQQPGAANCKENDLRFCHTDLASIAWRLSRLKSEDRRFGTVDKVGNSEAADGLLAQLVVKEGWKVFKVSGRCLIHHSPNPQQCAAQGGVWDDTGMADPASFGGECITQQELQQRMAAKPNKYQVLDINLSYDPESFGFKQYQQLKLRCARRADGASHGPWVFGRVCSARIDFHMLPSNLPPHPWDHMIPREWLQRTVQSAH